MKIATICSCVLLSAALSMGPVTSAVAQDAVPAPVLPAVAPQSATPSSPNTLLDGTAVKMRISDTISSADAKVGQEVPFEVLEDISVNGLIVIPKGAAAIGNVTAAEPKRSMGRAGKLDISISYVRLRDQEKAALRAVKDVKGGGHVGAMTGAMVATSIVFFPAAPLFLFMHGKDITIPQGTEMTAFVQGDMRLDMSQFGGAPGATLQAAVQGGPAASSSGPSPSSCSLVVQSIPSGADIEIDGAFVGNTPSTMTVAAGSHQVTIKKQGFADWNRTLNVTGGTINLNVEMNPAGN